MVVGAAGMALTFSRRGVSFSFSAHRSAHIGRRQAAVGLRFSYIVLGHSYIVLGNFYVLYRNFLVSAGFSGKGERRKNRGCGRRFPRWRVCAGGCIFPENKVRNAPGLFPMRSELYGLRRKGDGAFREARRRPFMPRRTRRRRQRGMVMPSVMFEFRLLSGINSLETFPKKRSVPT